MSTTTTKKTPKLREEVKAIANAEKLAKKLQKVHAESLELMKQFGSNPYIVKKGISCNCYGNTINNGSGMVEFNLQVSILIPESLIK